jgi:hypothetical protein
MKPIKRLSTAYKDFKVLSDYLKDIESYANKLGVDVDEFANISRSDKPARKIIRLNTKKA